MIRRGVKRQGAQEALSGFDSVPEKSAKGTMKVTSVVEKRGRSVLGRKP